MLQITVPPAKDIELWDDSTERFITIPGTKGQTLQLEHSLVSLSKWESKWNKAYLSKTEKTLEQIIDYIKCMTLTPDVDPHVYNHLTSENIEEIKKYIEAPMTATSITDNTSGGKTQETVTAELIYYWMISLNIPFECQYWHLNKLITLVKVCNIKNSPPKKMSRKETLSRNAQLNAARRKKMNTKG